MFTSTLKAADNSKAFYSLFDSISSFFMSLLLQTLASKVTDGANAEAA
jgi:hypothetical protein